MNLSKFFIDRPIFAGVLSLLFLVAGLLSLRVLPVSEYPEVVPPQVVVHAMYPGASPAVIVVIANETISLDCPISPIMKAPAPLRESLNSRQN